MKTVPWLSHRHLCFFFVWMLSSSKTVQQVFGEEYFHEPDGQRREQTFRVVEFEDSSINERFEGTLRYYCTFRGKWSKERHPNDFPKFPSWSAPVMISHSNGYRMWTGTETATLGVESIAEEGFPTIMTNEFANAGFETLHMTVGERLYNTTDSQHLPPINVTYDHPFLSSMVKITPSPDWFVGFSDLRMISYVTETFYNRIVIQSYVWDSGTDGGLTYTALDRDLDPQVPVKRFRTNNVPPKGQFLSPSGEYIPTPAEFECVLRVGEGPVIPGFPFDESHIRPPLYVPRDDDFINGEEPGPRGRRKPNGGSRSGASGKNLLTSLAATTIVVGTMMMALVL